MGGVFTVGVGVTQEFGVYVFGGHRVFAGLAGWWRGAVGGGGGSAGNKVSTTLREMRPLWKFHSSGLSQPCGDV